MARYAVQQDGEDIETGYDSPTKREALGAALELHAETMDSQVDIDEVQDVVDNAPDEEVEAMANNFGFSAYEI